MNHFNLKIRTLLPVLLCIVFAAPALVSAFSITNIVVEKRGDFVLEPGKQEIFLNPGESVTKQLKITNRVDHGIDFLVSVEDFTGSTNADQPVVLLGDERGPYSLKDFMKPEASSFHLEFGDQILLPVTISVPADVEPGGYYGAVIVANKPPDPSATSSEAIQSTRVVSRLGTLFLVRVNGPAKEEGEVTDFKPLGPKKTLYQAAPKGFEIQFKNTGNVHLVPHGIVSVKNTLGKVVATLPVDAYFALPNSVRYREILWTNPGVLLGRYKAHLSLYPGFGNATTELDYAFWVIPWKILAFILGAIIVFVALLYYISTRFEFRRKK